MGHMKSLLFGAALVIGIALQAQSSDLEAWTTGFVQSLPATHPFRGNILVESKGHVLLDKSFGLADESWKVPNERGGRFEIASLTKQFTAAAEVGCATAYTHLREGLLELKAQVEALLLSRWARWRCRRQGGVNFFLLLVRVHSQLLVASLRDRQILTQRT